MKIKHLSISSSRPEMSAKILAELTSGEVKPFPSKTMENAWMCVWDEAANELIEFIPNQYKLRYGEYAAVYEHQSEVQNFSASHFMLEATQSMSELARIADKHGLVHRFRARFGGPLYEVWLEETLLVEFCSSEIDSHADR